MPWRGLWKKGTSFSPTLVNQALAQKQAGWGSHMDKLVWLVCLGWTEVLTELPRREEGPSPPV